MIAFPTIEKGGRREKRKKKREGDLKKRRTVHETARRRLSLYTGSRKSDAFYGHAAMNGESRTRRVAQVQDRILPWSSSPCSVQKTLNETVSENAAFSRCHRSCRLSTIPTDFDQ